MTFAQPEWLWLLAIVPLWGFWLWYRRPERSLRYSAVDAVGPVGETLWAKLRGLPTVLKGAAIVLCIVGLARPQAHDVRTVQTSEGVSIMLVLDISSSMRAQDFDPNRLEAARDVAAEFVRSRPTDQIGLMVFASKPYTQVPPTLDHDFLLEMIDSIDIGMVEDGTAIGTALAASVNRLLDADADSRVVVLLTDGENNRGEIDPYTAASIAETQLVRVYTVGVSSFDQRGETAGPGVVEVQERPRPLGIDERVLQAIADRTGGAFFHASDTRGLRAVYQAISEMETTEIEMDTYTEIEDRYALFLWPAFVLLLLAVFLSATRLRRFP